MLLLVSFPKFVVSQGIVPYRLSEVEKTFDSEVHRLAEKYNQDETIARKIIGCESNTSNNSVNLSSVVGIDYGYFQLNSYFHEQRMREMGWNIRMPWDNLEYGFYLMSKEGTKPWIWSKPCWSK